MLEPLLVGNRAKFTLLPVKSQRQVFQLKSAKGKKILYFHALPMCQVSSNYDGWVARSVSQRLFFTASYTYIIARNLGTLPKARHFKNWANPWHQESDSVAFGFWRPSSKALLPQGYGLCALSKWGALLKVTIQWKLSGRSLFYYTKSNKTCKTCFKALG